MQITQTFDITRKYQKHNDKIRFEAVTEKGIKALDGMFGWNITAIEINGSGYVAQDLARDLEGDYEVKVLDLATVEAK
jgi:hypothetical protein